MRTQNEMSTASENPSGLVAREAMQYANSGALPGQAAGSHSESERSAVAVASVNLVAKGITDSLKSGGLLKGSVRSHSKIGDVDTVWVVVQLPVLGERQILVRNDRQLQVGQDVVVECVPTLAGTQRFVFRTANGTLTAPAVKAMAKSSCH